MMRKITAFVLCLALVLVSALFGHSGRTDRYGGHNNRKTGGYHYLNAGRAHAASNHHQNHKRCGICSTSKSQTKSTVTKDKQIMPLQAGLKCMGYEISRIDGKLGSGTKAAIAAFAKDYELGKWK